MISDTVRATRANLRWLLVLLPAVLFVTTVGTAVVQGQTEGSISAYYGGPLQDVFVGVLIGVAVLLVAYEGATAMEDYNFNGAALYAVFVALLPTRLIGNLNSLRTQLVLAPDGLTPSEYVWSLRITLSLLVVLGTLLVIRELSHRARLRGLLAGGLGRRIFVAVTFAVLVAFQALAMWQLWAPAAEAVTMEGLRSVPILSPIPFVGTLRIHDLAAIFLMCSLAAGVWCHAWPAAAAGDARSLPPGSTVWLPAYRAIFIAMMVGPFIAWGAAALIAPGKMVILLEWWVIAMFCVFWMVEMARQRRVRVTPGTP
ncbi:hypothetical protein SAMN02745244_03155 [Tessaracoccus bendigoensis DSM 12906]|uniref:Uncharacterized protein n=1 Tax=Tessaracoccus bendigoensis DSM 12906 TaxID=1123357 RepID=A0A1M6LSY1_9ACTN|nr:hypothetical protein [Tessaracoccus bendigoensis]SHJ74279.1 hypothetical protein SAMN02745244_03155 [Tessaracoccus bendigoensis DSM 12906]